MQKYVYKSSGRFLRQPPGGYDAIYLSPHLDDAALSCGGQIYELTEGGKSVLVVTVMAGDPVLGSASEFAQSLHERWRLGSDVVGARRAEDMAACRVMGADWEHWEFQDCIYRVDAAGDRPLYSSEGAIFGEIDSAELGLLDELAARMAQLPPHNQLYVPLTIGHHVDHQLTRQAAEGVYSAAALLYYEDYPYAARVSAEDFISRQPGSWQPKVIGLGERAIAARIRAIECYQSQVSTFFSDGRDLSQQIHRYVEAVGGERLWGVVQD